MSQKPWMKHLGKLWFLHEDIKEVNGRIDDVFEQIDDELWKSEEDGLA